MATMALATLGVALAAILVGLRRERLERERILAHVYALMGETHLQRRLRTYVEARP